MLEPWNLRVTPVAAREIPNDLQTLFATQPDIVEELSDRLRDKLGIESSIDLGTFAANRSELLHAGTIVTVRYAPKVIHDNEHRLAHADIAEAIPAGAIVVTDARECSGSILGGVAAELIAGGGGKVDIIDGSARDIPEVDAAGLIVIAARFGIQSGRPTVQALEIGGSITFRERLVTSGDVGVVNRYGLVTIPGWLPWDDVRAIMA